ncbi:MAG: hypothetical protein IH594_15925, partial [Bacteroidales bacterium]|nr:hypothetical protein [Bacteroidales bacterium]
MLIVLCAACIFGCRRAGAWLMKDDLPSHADAMVLLMGSFPERVIQAADLYRDGLADRLIIVHESMGSYRLLESLGADI